MNEVELKSFDVLIKLYHIPDMSTCYPCNMHDKIKTWRSRNTYLFQILVDYLICTYIYMCMLTLLWALELPRQEEIVTYPPLPHPTLPPPPPPHTHTHIHAQQSCMHTPTCTGLSWIISDSQVVPNHFL